MISLIKLDGFHASKEFRYKNITPAELAQAFCSFANLPTAEEVFSKIQDNATLLEAISDLKVKRNPSSPLNLKEVEQFTSLLEQLDFKIQKDYPFSHRLGEGFAYLLYFENYLNDLTEEAIEEVLSVASQDVLSLKLSKDYARYSQYFGALFFLRFSFDLGIGSIDRNKELISYLTLPETCELLTTIQQKYDSDYFKGEVESNYSDFIDWAKARFKKPD